MRKVLLGIFLILALSVPAEAVEITAPEVPRSGMAQMPGSTDSFGDALMELTKNGVRILQPEFREALRICSGVLFSAILFSFFSVLSNRIRMTTSLAGALTISAGILRHTGAMITYASEAVWEICEYGKLLFPVLTTALASQGAITASAALYAGTAAFISLLSSLVSALFLPMIYIFLTFSVAYCALEEEVMKQFADAIKRILIWMMKTMVIVFTTYMSITGVVSGTTDAAALKAAKVAISTVVPVVGGILADASDSVLTSIGIMKNAAGIYGILAVLSVCIVPFIKVGVQCLLLKMTAFLCSVLGNKRIAELVENFSAVMGMLLAMVALGCLLVLIGIVCFMKGSG